MLALLPLLALPIAVLAQSAQQTEVLFADGFPQQEWAASVVDQDACGTTLNLVCTAGEVSYSVFGYGYETISCDPNGFESGFASASATYSGNSIYEVTQSFNFLRNGGAKIEARETCSIYDSTSVLCSATNSVSARGLQTLVDTITTYEGAEASDKFYQVPITAGSITTANGTCATPASFATPTPVDYGSASVVGAASSSVGQVSSADAGKVQVAKVVVVPGAALLLAGAGLL